MGKRPEPVIPVVLIVVLLAAVGIVGYFKLLPAPIAQPSSPPTPKVNSPPSGKETISGRASVIDGDTIEIHGTRIRLFGIDAPESGQACTTAEGKEYRCGQRAALALADKIKTQTVECQPKTHDQYGRVVAVCSVSGEDINVWMVSQGWALAYRQYSSEHLSQERSAANSKLGLWQGEFEAPWDWRRNHPDRPRVPESRPSRPSKGRYAVYYRPDDLSGARYQTMTECEQARQRAGNVGVCVTMIEYDRVGLVRCRSQHPANHLAI